MKFFLSFTGVVFFALVSPVMAIEYGGFWGRPAYPRPDNTRSESIFVHTLEPGTEQTEGVKVINNTAERKTFLVFAADSTPSTDGAFACKQLSEEKAGVWAWIKLKKNEVTLASNANEIVPFVISVPKNAGVGEHNGCILIQEKTVAEPWKVGVSLSVRTGIRVALTIPGEIVRKLEIVDFSLDRTDKGIVLHPQVKNTGNVSIDTQVDVVTRNIFWFVFMRHGGQYPILRGDTSDWNFELKRPLLWGIYRSQFFVTYDENKEASVGVESGKNVTKLRGSTLWFFAMPSLVWFILDIILICLVGFLIFLVYIAQKRKKWITDSWVTYTVKGSEDINSLALEHNISWKILARVNKLQPPYVLKKNQKIQVPPRD
jgi:hypothetical protein